MVQNGQNDRKLRPCKNFKHSLPGILRPRAGRYPRPSLIVGQLSDKNLRPWFALVRRPPSSAADGRTRHSMSGVTSAKIQFDF